MAGIGERLWEIGKSPPHHMTLLVFGLLALLTGLVTSAIISVAGGGGAAAPLLMVANVLVGVGAFFLALALFLGAYVASGDSPTAVVWKVAQLLAAVFVLIILF